MSYGAIRESKRDLSAPSVTLPLAVGAVFFVAGVVQLAHSWPAIGDWAIAELIVRHVGRHLPLSGPYSAQRGYNHPLPWVYAIEWLPYRSFGSRSSAAPAMALWWNGAGISIVVWLLARRKATGLAVLSVAALLLLALRETGVRLLLPWNPNLAVVPAFALLFVSWRVALGERRLLPVQAGLAVWCVGAHLGYLPFTTVLLVGSWVPLLTRAFVRTNHESPRALLRPALVGLGVVAILITPMIVDLAASGSRSNPAQIVKRAAPGAKDRPSVPKSDVMKVFRAELAIPPAWTRAKPAYDVLAYRPAARAPLLLVPAMVVVAAAWRRRARDELMGIGLTLFALAGATLGLVFVDDTALRPWYLLPGHIASAVLFAFVLWSGARSLGELARNRRGLSIRADRPLQLRSVVALPIFALLGTTFAVASMRTPFFHAPIAATTKMLARPIEQRFPPGTHLVVDGPIAFDGYYTQSLMLQLDRAGYSVRVPDRDLYMFTDAFAIPDHWNGTTLTIQISESAPTPPKPGARLVARVIVPERLTFAGRTLSVWQQAAPARP